MAKADAIETTRATTMQVALLVGSGIIAAAQIGKAIISLPLIRSEFALGLDLAGLIVAIFAALGAFMGIGAGVVVGRLGVRRSLIGGMGLIALGNVIGACAPDERILFAARLIEGIGFFGSVLAIPSIIARIVAPEKRDVVMALWSAYMPAGIVLMLLVGPLLPAIGWRNLWLANAILTGACAVLLGVLLCAPPQPPRHTAARLAREVAGLLRQPGCLLLAFAFFCFSCQIFSLAFALLLLLTSTHGLSLGTAGLMSSLALAASAIGGVTSGLLLRAGVPLWANIASSFAFFAVAALIVYAGGHAAPTVALTAVLALGIGGLAPGAIYAAAPQVAPSPQAVPSMIGMVQQASNLGQFAGPLVLGLWVEQFGWRTAPALVTPAALLGLVSALVLRRVLAATATADQSELSLAQSRS